MPQNAEAGGINTADIKDVHVTLPEGMTLNPSAAHGLEACSAGQIGIGTTSPVTCPAASRVGGVRIETDLPPGSLAGNVYLGNPGGGPITGPPYTIYLDAESVYGVSVRLQGAVNPNPSSGRLEATFTNNPQLPFSALVLTLNGGARAPLANPLVCGTEHVEALFTPYTGLAPALSSTPFLTTGCPSPLPFSLTQTTQNASANAGAFTAYTLNLARADGQQYLSKVSTVLPAGLVGVIPSVTLCPEPQAQAGACTPASEIGQATVNVGAGPEPYAFSGPVFLTGPYGGAPYGLSIPVAAVAGPFNLGTVVTRATINVDPHERARDRHEHAADDRQGHPPEAEGPQHRRQQTPLPVEPHQLRGACERLRADVDIRRASEPGEPVAGRQLRRARVQALVPGDHQRQDVQSQRGEPGNDHRPAARTGEHPVGLRAAAQAAPIAADHPAEGVPGSNVRREPLQLPERLVRRRCPRQHAGAARRN